MGKREENQRLCNEFLQSIDKQFEEFKAKTGIEINIVSDHEYAALENAPMCSEIVTVYKRMGFNYSPRIKHSETSWEYIYGDNTLGNPPKKED
ncbi:MAG: hypothetical protein A3D31_06275 [Candidatus Fluviicola riflensis]|nr:MAG: hypothetical protein CHH17_08740 [Candidatus Fluviicola riflensis]OGS79569.1 MAG: hypothetical protein A3D31_06275 [Candidatus Fluviicola riflensis]OGS87000.1 MAG: hypothetical protein A2724_05735 [Fluviicola sp. RIFCSPHIGHO2_01_FULL_43_53]OGS89791.1 MAG: hypothetical protein A3E30_02480 [Fluviicola sp. RIFCSPHIGHO2_12_FULL_43_24]